MAIRFRKSMKIAPGVRLSVSKSGLGVSAGVRGARYSVHTSGRRTTTVGIPGTGISHVSTSGSGGGRRASSGGASSCGVYAPAYAEGANAAAYLAKAGLFAGAGEKRYREGLVAYLTGDKAAAVAGFEAALAADPKATSAHLMAALSIDTDVDMASVIRHLEALLASNDPFPDKHMNKFLPPGQADLAMGVKLADFIEARVPFNLTGAALVLAEAYQKSGRGEEAIGLVQQLHDANPQDPSIRLSLVDVLFDDQDYEGIVELTSSARNEDDLSLALVYMRGAALTALGHQTAAFDAFKQALAKTAKRDPALLATVRYDRAQAYEQAGQKARARADYERLYASDPNYRDVRDRLAAL
jgi:tetratricopeptide (TPR) repeat protein